MKQLLKLFKSLVCGVFILSCCHIMPSIKSYKTDHPANPDSVFFIVQNTIVPFVEDQELRLISKSTGSGGAIKSTPTYTDILTAGHVCMLTTEHMFLVDEYWAWSVKGDKFKAHVIAIDSYNDLCILRIKHSTKSVVSLAEKDPTKGEHIYYAGYPEGLYTNNTLHFLSGYFSGKDAFKTSVWTIPAAPGSSGSLVLNSKGELVGVVSAVLANFRHMTIGPSVEQIRIFLLLTSNCEGYDLCFEE